ncbi:DUF222 domain-containing protein [Arthrobacter sp. AL08]|uniref:HNH endonuclease signature motif containing protein n=1 Tax=Micrococcaceae TaxID=1268 RepID=UPI001CFFE887|nr:MULTISPECIES: HNH endonuclease signature motif containing protein [Micrococcaceae]MCB5280866.1 hypothetical protein [Arthrobacter sp. ES1]MDI3241576.1 DUF222 domain-containing protein [Arthrobacter sp. AL05]MDI3277586.1 DUF222 domain-containing protein [Arthrobacter sp. AL08]MDJ0353532.1 DUF222 domain-containing protein [Pseudarthrobacter sp. PH31-O2]WGZ80644.1 DUF222 domain-containing protein [Arthrobacter sp. EM1]
MEASRDFITVRDTDRRVTPAGQSGVDDALATLRAVGSTAVEAAAGLGFASASDFAGTVEELSRVVEYLQVVATGAVERTRKQAAATTAGIVAGNSWTTGWREDPGTGAGCGTGAGAGAEPEVRAAGREVAAGLERAAWGEPARRSLDAAPAPAVAVDDGYRNVTEFLRARLRISSAEARRRLCLAGTLLPRQGFTGQDLPALRAELGATVAAGEVPSRSATIITLALDRVRHVCDEATAARMEHALTRTAADNDPDFLARVARSWTDAIDQDGAEPSEELLRQLQGAFIRKPRQGLAHLEIFATTEQFEHLLTVMNTATNPRTSAAVYAEASGASDASGSSGASGTSGDPGLGGAAAAQLDLRSRPQRLLDGLVGACKVALATGSLPAAGGLRPQVMVTIDYRGLLALLRTSQDSRSNQTSRANRQAGTSDSAGRTMAHTGSLLFSGPVNAATARKIACDADIIPVLLGSEGRVLDIGRATRVFPPHIRKALIARDQGCAFPGCTIPASWCEAHHVDYWSRGGTTGTDNGTLLCSHHHHVIHKEQWTIQVRTGVPWFIPPPHVDPRQQPRRNTYFHLASTEFTAS